MRGGFYHLLLRGRARRQRLGSVGQGQQREGADAGVTHDVGQICKGLFERGNVGCVAAMGESVILVDRVDRYIPFVWDGLIPGW